MLKRVSRVFEVSRHRQFCLIKKAYKLLSGAEKTEVTITTLPHLTLGLKVMLWYDMTFKHSRLVAAVSLLPFAQGWGARYQVVQEIYESDPGYGRIFKHCASYPEYTVDSRGRDDISNR